MNYENFLPAGFSPLADPQAVVCFSGLRVSVLGGNLLRIEYDPREKFEDRPSQAFWNRRQSLPQFTSEIKSSKLTLRTSSLELIYTAQDQELLPGSLQVRLLNNPGEVWRYAERVEGNLLGTTRTLDETKGAIELENGLLSRSGWSLVDDSRSLVFNQEGWLEPRGAGESYRDLYFFAHVDGYQTTLDDFCKVAGPAPLVPRWMLGNWWSRYWAYSQAELSGLMQEFQNREVPLSVCIVDMDWHLTRTNNRSTGWTGYTWNRELFPDPQGFVQGLHAMGLRTALNLHPAEGIHPHEQQYAEFAEAMGIDPKSKQPVKFDIADPKFTENYFKILHHPQEEMGIDFWWLDWQQGTDSTIAGLDPLWWLNHLHFYDLGREEQKRPVIFSRWGGLGNHRYPIGFSGDTVVSWESLRFQPLFTSTAANVNYGWWSHDIGGHMSGLEDAELFVRWIQFGVFSPIFRLHCTNNPFHERLPWGWDAETDRITSEYMRLRHKLIPYLYSMNYCNHLQNKPLVRPMYQEYENSEEAYHFPDQYLFGSELLVSPYLEAAEESVGLSRKVTWLPEGFWFNFFNGDIYQGGEIISTYGKLEETPVYAKAGAIVPLAALQDWNESGNPADLEILCFPLGDNDFVLYEDDGRLARAETHISQTWGDGEWRISLQAPAGEAGFLPAQRRYSFLLRGVRPEVNLEIKVNGETQTQICQTYYNLQTRTLELRLEALSSGDDLEIILTPAGETFLLQTFWKADVFGKLLKHGQINTWVKAKLGLALQDLFQKPETLNQFERSFSTAQKQAFCELLYNCGVQVNDHLPQGKREILLWNTHPGQEINYLFSILDQWYQPRAIEGTVPNFAVFELKDQRLDQRRGSEVHYRVQGIAEWLEKAVSLNGTGLPFDFRDVVQLQIMDVEGGSLAFSSANGCLVVRQELQQNPGCLLHIRAEDWLGILNGTLSFQDLMKAGRLYFKGDIDLLISLGLVFNPAFLEALQPDTWKIQVRYPCFYTAEFFA